MGSLLGGTQGNNFQTAGEMKIQVGKPLDNGRYVVFVRCASPQIKDWCEPEIATWHDGLWHHGKAHVHGWIGPLPLARWKALVNEANATEQPEWDL